MYTLLSLVEYAHSPEKGKRMTDIPKIFADMQKGFPARKPNGSNSPPPKPPSKPAKPLIPGMRKILGIR